MAAIYKRGPGHWQVLVRRKGYPLLSKSFKKRTDAEAWAREIEAEMDRGVFVSRKEAENTTLSGALERYEREVSSEKKGGSRKRPGSNDGRIIRSENVPWPRFREKTSRPIGTHGSRKFFRTPSGLSLPSSPISSRSPSRNGAWSG